MAARRRHVAIAVLASLILLVAGRTGVRPLRAEGKAGAPLSAPADLKPTVILVSIDAWRWDFRTRVTLPALEGLIARGVRAEWLIPSFPSKTFPSHYTIATGLYPGHHGIVANTMWDEATGRTFSMSRREEVQDAMWWGGEPIWVTAERAGQRTAPIFWPGSEAPIGGRLPSYWERFDDKVPGRERIARILSLLDLPADRRPTFLTLYAEEIDTSAHKGPDRPEMREALLKADAWLGELVAGLEQRGLLPHVNVVVVSDHGMAATSRDRVVVLDDYISLDDVRVIDLNPTLGLYPKPGKDEAVYRALRKAHPRLKVYRRGETPTHWHYRDHPRIPPIVGVVDDGWQILRRRTVDAIDAGTLPRESGQHGYDPRVRSMRALFVAAGPAFREGVVVKPFESVSLYNMFARILGVTPARNDGDPRVVDRVLR